MSGLIDLTASQAAAAIRLGDVDPASSSSCIARGRLRTC
jgi:hypothetical protein